MLVGALIKRKIDPRRSISSRWGLRATRARQQMAGRVDAVPMHIEQAAELATKGDYQILGPPVGGVRQLAQRRRHDHRQMAGAGRQQSGGGLPC